MTAIAMPAFAPALMADDSPAPAPFEGDGAVGEAVCVCADVDVEVIGAVGPTNVTVVTLVATVDEGAGVDTWTMVERFSGSAASTTNSEGLWQLRVSAVLSQHLHSVLARS